MPTPETNKDRLDRYIGINEKSHDKLNASIENLKDNHLAHLKDDVNDLDKKVT